METKQKECEICGVWFTPSRSSQKYCPECGKDSTKAWRDLHKHMQYSVARVGTVLYQKQRSNANTATKHSPATMG